MGNSGNKVSMSDWFTYLILTIAIVAAGLWVPRGLNWAIVAASMALFGIKIGLHVTGRAAGIFIDERNEISLSRFQIATWTLIILSAFITIALVRVSSGEPEPLAIKLPWQLWALMGISTTSLVGAPLIRGTKKGKKPTDEARDKAATLRRTDVTDIDKTREGTLFVKESIDDAGFYDMFRGEEVANTPHIDMAKVQMFFFTLVAALSYTAVLFKWIVTKEPATLFEFPELSEGLVAILGISHAGYLGNKVIDHTKTD